jgi:cation:H+ antiporter
LSFQNFPIWINLLIFLLAAIAIWYAGSRLERYTDAISQRTQLGKAFLGLLLLATVTDLPEIATTTTAILAGNKDLALYNLFGSIIFQTAILAGVDILLSKGPLTRFIPNFAVLMQGVGLILVIAATLVAISFDAGLSSALNLEDSLLPIGLGPLVAFAAYLIVIFLSHRAQGNPRWLPTELTSGQEESLEQNGQKHIGVHEQQSNGSAMVDGQVQKKPWNQLLLEFAGFALVVLLAGWAVATVGDSLAEQTGLGASFVGFTLLSIATSLPEISTTTSAVRNGNYSLAYSNIFGSNAFDIALLLPAALIYQGVLFEDVSHSIVYAGGLGILMTCIFIWGLLERRDWTILRMGWDSFTVTILCLLGIIGFYFLR